MVEQVILVDENDCQTGAMEKLQAHREGLLHRAFSVFVFDRQGRLLLQKRASGKYHSAGLWSNTACGHPRPGEDLRAAARRRLKEEMGFECELAQQFRFTYRTELENGLTEHECDYVLTGCFTGSPAPDESEVSEWKWIGANELLRDLSVNSESYTHWFKMAVSLMSLEQAAGR